MKRTKIVATLGPSSANAETVKKLIEEGVNVFRLNTSHLDDKGIQEYCQLVISVRSGFREDVAMLVDLQGPRVRTTQAAGGSFELNEGEIVELKPGGGESSAKVIYTDYSAILDDLKTGNILLVDDGLIRLKVTSVNSERALLTVETGGSLKSRKGMNLEGGTFSLDSVTERDIRFIRAALKYGGDMFAVSFVRTRRDIEFVKDVLKLEGKQIPVIAKIESPLAVSNFDEILEEADGVMVARGDLGVESPFFEVPFYQKRLIKLCNAKAKPVITATQMMESMIEHKTPTRAEVTDVANAILDGTDAIMLSAETASGAHPIDVVRTMRRIAERAEEEVHSASFYWSEILEEEHSLADAVCLSACEIAREIKAAAIIAPTTSGYSARMLSRFKPRPPILALCYNETVLRGLSLSFGVFPVVSEYLDDLEKVIERGISLASDKGFVKRGDYVVVAGGLAKSSPGAANFIRVEEVK